MTGEIFGLAASGRSAATDVTVFTAPVPPAAPLDLFDIGAHVKGNTFIVNNGQIATAFFSLLERPYSGSANLNFKILDFGRSLGFSYGFTYSSLRNAATNIFNASRGDVKFTPATAASAVPEPASIVLLGAGLAGISAFRRRRLAG